MDQQLRKRRRRELSEAEEKKLKLTTRALLKAGKFGKGDPGSLRKMAAEGLKSFRTAGAKDKEAHIRITAKRRKIRRAKITAVAKKRKRQMGLGESEAVKTGDVGTQDQRKLKRKKLARGIVKGLVGGAALGAGAMLGTAGALRVIGLAKTARAARMRGLKVGLGT